MLGPRGKHWSVSCSCSLLRKYLWSLLQLLYQYNYVFYNNKLEGVFPLQYKDWRRQLATEFG